MLRSICFFITLLFLTTILQFCSREYPDHVEKLLQKAKRLSDEGKLEESLTYYDKADSACPNVPFIIHERGLVKSHLKNFDGAIEDINQSIRLEENDKTYMINNRALIYLEMGDTIKACQDWKLLRHENYLDKYCR